MRLPELQKYIQVLRDITCLQQPRRRMRAIQSGQRHRGRLKKGWKAGRRFLLRPATRGRNLQASAADLLLVELRQNLARHRKFGDCNGLDGRTKQRLKRLPVVGLDFKSLRDG